MKSKKKKIGVRKNVDKYRQKPKIRKKKVVKKRNVNSRTKTRKKVVKKKATLSGKVNKKKDISWKMFRERVPVDAILYVLHFYKGRYRHKPFYHDSKTSFTGVIKRYFGKFQRPHSHGGPGPVFLFPYIHIHKTCLSKEEFAFIFPLTRHNRLQLPDVLPEILEKKKLQSFPSPPKRGKKLLPKDSSRPPLKKKKKKDVVKKKSEDIPKSNEPTPYHLSGKLPTTIFPPELCSILRNSNTERIRYAFLEGVEIGAEGAIAILKYCSNLTDLSLGMILRARCTKYDRQNKAYPLSKELGEALASHQNLKRFSWSTTGIRKEGIVELSKSLSIENIRIESDLFFPTFDSLKNLKNLKSLRIESNSEPYYGRYLPYNKEEDTGEDQLFFENFKASKIEFLRIKDSVKLDFSKLSIPLLELKILELERVQKIDNPKLSFRNLVLFCPNLVQLSIGLDEYGSVENLTPLGELQKLEVFRNPMDVHFGDKGCEILSRIRSLKKLDLPQHHNIYDESAVVVGIEGVRYLTKLENLEWLDISRSKADEDVIIEMMEKCSRLKWLDISLVELKNAKKGMVIYENKSVVVRGGNFGM